MDGEKKGLIILSAVGAGIVGHRIYTGKWIWESLLSNLPSHPSHPWRENEELTEKVRRSIPEGYVGITVTVYEDVSDTYPRDIRLYTKPVAPEAGWEFFDTGQVTKEGGIINLETPWREQPA